jgi:hypothetical protein
LQSIDATLDGGGTKRRFNKLLRKHRILSARQEFKLGSID